MVKREEGTVEVVVTEATEVIEVTEVTEVTEEEEIEKIDLPVIQENSNKRILKILSKREGQNHKSDFLNHQGRMKTKPLKGTRRGKSIGKRQGLGTASKMRKLRGRSQLGETKVSKILRINLRKLLTKKGLRPLEEAKPMLLKRVQICSLRWQTCD